MSDSIIQRSGSWLARGSSAPEGLSRAQSRTLAHREGEEVMRGLVVGARMQAKGYATALAVQVIGLASREAAYQSGGDPKTIARMDLVVDQLAISAANEIGRM